MPSIKILKNIDGRKLKTWLDNDDNGYVVKKHVYQHYDEDEKEILTTYAFYLLKNNLLLSLQAEAIEICHNSEQEEIAKTLLLSLRTFVTPKRKTQHICIVVNSFRGVDTLKLKLKKPRLKLTNNYNDDLILLHQKLLPILKQKDKSGLILFHGLPGTGKSTYIRYLIRCVNKKVIFMPPGLAGNLDAPSISNLLLMNANTIFVIEDAEELLLSRELNKNSSISMLLNLTDGLLGEALGIQIIATFNTQISNIDQALLRKGRLIAMYEFKALAAEKAMALLQELKGIVPQVGKAMTLAEIYHTGVDEVSHPLNSRNQIGFMNRMIV